MNTAANKHPDPLSFTPIQTHLSLQHLVSYHHREEQISDPFRELSSIIFRELKFCSSSNLFKDTVMVKQSEVRVGNSFVTFTNDPILLNGSLS